MPPQFVEVKDMKLPLDGKQSNDPHFPVKSRTKINRSRIGVWDFYEEVEVDPPRISLAELQRRYRDFADTLPYVVLMVKDVLAIPGCASLMIAYAAAEFFQALIPATLIWCVFRRHKVFSLWLTIPILCRFQGEALKFVRHIAVQLAAQ